MSDHSTPNKILDAAEQLFAEHGIAAVSLRKIIAAAGVNIAAIHYHFGCKDELIRAVFRRRIVAVNSKRLEALATLRSGFGAEPIPIVDLVRAFLEPAVTLGRSGGEGGKAFFRLVARAHAETEPACQEVMFEELRSIIQEFLKELTRSLPDLEANERAMRLMFSAGAMVQAVMLPFKPLFVEQFLGGEVNDMLEMLVSFCVGGLCAEGAPK